MTAKLSDLCVFADGRVATADLNLDAYISTENMLPNKEGITRSAGLPTVNQTQTYQADDLLVLRAKGGCKPGFLYYLLSDDNFFDYATATVKGTKIPHGDKGAIMRYEVPDLPMDVQIGIADTLSALDAQVSKNRAIDNHLEQMAQAIFKSWFVDFEPFGGVMPDDWRDGILNDIAPLVYSGGTLDTGTVSFRGGDIPWLSSGETRNHFVITAEKTISQSGVENSSTRLAHRYDVVMASAGRSFTRGQTSLLMIDSYTNQPVIVMSGQHPLYLFLNLFGRYEELRAISDSGSIRGSINTKMLARFPMRIPSTEALDEFSELVLPLVEQIENNLNESARLATLCDTLLPRLLSGELSVADVDAK